MTLLLSNLHMGFLDLHGRTARVFYNNIIYLFMTLFGALVLASLNADTAKEGEDWEARYTKCSLDGSVGTNSTCPGQTQGQSDQLLQLFNISVAVVVINILLLVLSIATHWGYGIALQFMLQPVFSLVNLGLFSGLVGWFNFSDGISEDLNTQFNVYFQDYNPYVVAIFGLVAGILDTVVFTTLKFFYFKERCDAGKMPQTDGN